MPFQHIACLKSPSIVRESIGQRLHSLLSVTNEWQLHTQGAQWVASWPQEAAGKQDFFPSSASSLPNHLEPGFPARYGPPFLGTGGSPLPSDGSSLLSSAPGKLGQAASLLEPGEGSRGSLPMHGAG